VKAGEVDKTPENERKSLDYTLYDKSERIWLTGTNIFNCWNEGK